MLFRLLRSYTKPYQGRVVLISVLVLIQAIISLYLPRLNADIVNQGVSTGDIAYIWQVGGWMLVLTIVSMALAVWSAWHNAFVSMAFARALRRDVFAKVLGFTAQEVDRFGTPYEPRLGGAATMYPEYIAKIKTMPKPTKTQPGTSEGGN